MQAARFHDRYKDYPFSKIYISELIRTRQSIELFTNNGRQINEMGALDEINWGKFEGKEFSKGIKDEFYHILNEWNSGNIDITSEGGETPRQLASRLKTGIEEVMDDSGMEDILICTHGRTMKALFCVLLDIHLSKMDSFKHTNLCLYKFETTDGRNFDMTLVNETSHLKGLKVI